MVMVGYAKYHWMFSTFDRRAKVYMKLVDEVTVEWLRDFKRTVFLFLLSPLALLSGAPLAPFLLQGRLHAPPVRPPLRALPPHLPWIWGWGGATRVRTKGAAAGLGARELRLPRGCRREAAWLLPAFTALAHGPVRADTPTDLTAVDRLGLPLASEGRFLLWYLVTTHRPAARVAVTVPCPENASVPSLTPLHPAWEWPEREVWDMFGVRFRPHPDLRRILTDYAFRGFPLRKDFPVVGFKQVRYDEGFSAVVYENLFLMQDEREVLLVNPWRAAARPGLKTPPPRAGLRPALLRAACCVEARARVLFACRTDSHWHRRLAVSHRRPPPRDHYGKYDEDTPGLTSTSPGLSGDRGW